MTHNTNDSNAMTHYKTIDKVAATTGTYIGLRQGCEMGEEVRVFTKSIKNSFVAEFVGHPR